MEDRCRYWVFQEILVGHPFANNKIALTGKFVIKSSSLHGTQAHYHLDRHGEHRFPNREYLLKEEDSELPLVQLAPHETSGQRIALEESLSTFSMPVSSLKFEPLVDVQSRNSVESQGDVTIRGGIFENTGFMLGAATLFDPQTGHYFAEIPVAPNMISSPGIITGSENAFAGFNSGVGSVQFGWRPIRPFQELALGSGEDGLLIARAYAAHTVGTGDRNYGFDVEVAHSESDGAIANGDHLFDRISGRFQVSNDRSQTDFFYGYQTKFFGWPNMYTPFGVPETEDLETNLLFPQPLH